MLTCAYLITVEDLIAVVTLQGRLLVFPAAALPALAKGKGNKLIQIPTPDLAAGTDKVVAFTAAKSGVGIWINLFPLPFANAGKAAAGKTNSRPCKVTTAIRSSL
jgi:DNA gyrase/topoisomerase IV subunit A